MRWTLEFVVWFANKKGFCVEKERNRTYSVWKDSDPSVVAECKNLQEVIDTMNEMGYN